MFDGIFSRLFASVCDKCGEPTAPFPDYRPPESFWFDNFRNLFNLVNFVDQEEFGSQCIENVRTNMVECDLRQFFNIKPENITIDVRDHSVSLRGQQEDKSEDGTSNSTHMVQSMFSLPPSADMSRLSAHYSPNGHVILRAPMLSPAMSSEKQSRPGIVPIQINRKKNGDEN